MVRLLLSLLTLILFGCGGGSGGGAVSESQPPPEPQYYGSVSVSLKGVDSQPIVGATVRISNQAAVSDENGACLFDGVPVGTSAVSAVKAGMQPVSTSVVVEKDAVVFTSLDVSNRSGDAEYDVIVVGAGTGGVAAAVQARNSGMRVALLEETDWIGGQMTAAAVTSLDEGADVPRMRSGVYGRFVNKVARHYWNLSRSTGTAYFASHMIAFEPSVGQKKLYELLHDVDGATTTVPRGELDLYLRTDVERVEKAGNRVTGLVLKKGGRMSAKVVVDATEYGDVLAAAGARYRVGNTTSDNVRQTACTQFITYTAVIRKYFGPMDSQLLISQPPPGYENALPDFRRFVTNDGNFMSQVPVSFYYHNAWRGMPDPQNPVNYTADPGNERHISKTGINWFNDHAVSARYVEDREYRKTVNCEAKLKTLQFIYYIQKELGHTDWSVADDEGFATTYNRDENSCQNIPETFKAIERHFPLKPYVREARRGLGLMTLTAADIRREGEPLVAVRKFPSALAVGDYPVDLHGCYGSSTLDCGETAADIPSWGGGTFQVPFEVFIPESVDGLVFAEKNISVSRLVNGATRLQPITMMTGQAAGAIAALSVRQNVQPRKVQPIQVQSELLDAGCHLVLYNLRDVPASHAYRKQIQLALLYDIISPTNSSTFGAAQGISASDLEYGVLFQAFNLPLHGNVTSVPASRSYLARLLAEGMSINLSNAPTEPYFTDVPPSHPDFSAIQRLHQLGIWPPVYTSAGKFLPDATVTKGEAAYAIMTALQTTGITPRSYKTFTSVDRTAPTGSISINGGAAITSSSTVQLTLNAQDEHGIVVSMQLSKDRGATWHSWEPYSSQRTATLLPGTGVKSISVRYRDNSNNVSQVFTGSIERSP